MTTETAPDPVIHDWSDRLEEDLVEAGMDAPQARAYSRAFELGMSRVMSIMATKRDLEQMRDDLRREMEIRGRYLVLAMTVGFGVLAGLLGAILTKL